MIITGAVIGGIPLPACDILSAVTVRHGRDSWGAAPTASVAEITVTRSTVPPWTAGDTLVLLTARGPAFTGRITDRAATRDSGSIVIDVAASGALADLARTRIGDEPWPPEPVEQRAERILTLAAPHGGWDIQRPVTEATVLPRDVDSKAALDILNELTTSTAAALFDTPDGRIVWQPLTARRKETTRATWEDQGTRTWSQAQHTWAATPGTGGRPVTVIPPCAVAAGPAWASDAGTIVNSVGVTWGVAEDGGQQRPQADWSHPGSIARHGLRRATLTTELADEADALLRASRIIAQQHTDRWEITGVTVLGRELTDPWLVGGLRCGDWVSVDGLQLDGSRFVGIVEGWVLEQDTDGLGTDATLTLAVSSPGLSLAGARWVDTGGRWMDQGTRWDGEAA